MIVLFILFPNVITSKKYFFFLFLKQLHVKTDFFSSLYPLLLSWFTSRGKIVQAILSILNSLLSNLGT